MHLDERSVGPNCRSQIAHCMHRTHVPIAEGIIPSIPRERKHHDVMSDCVQRQGLVGPSVRACVRPGDAVDRRIDDPDCAWEMK